MKMAKPTAAALAAFEALVPTEEGIGRRPVFGQPAAFLEGNMFLGVFGDTVIVRLSEADRERAASELGARPFEPMPGRPMREYVVLPANVFADRAVAKSWVDRAVAFASRLPKKKPKARGRAG